MAPGMGTSYRYSTYLVTVGVLLLVYGVPKVQSGTTVVAVVGGKSTAVDRAPELNQKGFDTLPKKKRAPRRYVRNRALGGDDDEGNDDEEEEEEEEEEHSNQYGGGVVPEENENEIDCFAFEHMDELPSFCVGIENQQPVIGSDNATVAPGVGETEIENDDLVSTENGNETTPDVGSMFPSQGPILYPTPSPDSPNAGNAPNATLDDDVSSVVGEGNSIWLPLSMALFKPQDLSQSMARSFVASAVHVIGILLHRYTPYDVDLSRDSEYGFEFMNRTDRRYLGEEEGNYNDQYLDSQTQDGDEYGSTSSQYDPPPSSGYEPAICLRVLHVEVWESTVWEQWIHFNVTYTVFWPEGDPMMNQPKLDFVEDSCLEVLNTTIETGRFWAELLEADQETHFVVKDDEDWSKRGTYLMVVLLHRAVPIAFMFDVTM